MPQNGKNTNTELGLRRTCLPLFAPSLLHALLLLLLTFLPLLPVMAMSACTPFPHASTTRVADPLLSLQGHDGPAYDLKFFGEGENSVLLSCGDDGRIHGWHWRDIVKATNQLSKTGNSLEPAFVFVNPQHKGPRRSLSPMPETNALDTDTQGSSIFSATGNGLAYSWDIETGKIKMVFEGHSDYLHCICARSSHNQVITGSEDGTARMWDCRNGQCTAILDPWKAIKLTSITNEKSPWVSCMAIDPTENWLVCGNGGKCVTLWSLPGLDAVTRIATLAIPQAITVANDQIVMVGAQPHLSRFNYGGKIISQVACAPLSAFSVSVQPSGITVITGFGGLVDVLSEFGSHICIFRCR
eukprot:c24765_g1_i2 orf=481-1548(-)